jgi:PEP-CTERM motif
MKRLNVVLCGLILATLPSTSALADTLYTYTGNAFTSNDLDGGPDSPFSTSSSVSVWFTVVTPLGDNLAFTDITPTNYSISNGVTTFTSADPSSYFSFEVGTDATGAINLWIIEQDGLDIPDVGVNAAGTFNNSALYGVDDFGVALGGNLGLNRDDPGTWTSASSDPSPATTPEPSALFLLGTGALGLVGMVRRRLVV